MTIRLFIFAFGFFLAASCRDEKNLTPLCGVNKPVEDLAWIQTHIAEWEKEGWSNEMWITTATHMNETVLIFGNCCINCLSIYYVYNCTGEKIGSVDQVDQTLLDRDALIWKSHDSLCNLL